MCIILFASALNGTLGAVGGVAALFSFDLKRRIIASNAGAAIPGIVLGYLVVAPGPGLVRRVAGMAITGLTDFTEFSYVYGITRGGWYITEIRRLGAWR